MAKDTLVAEKQVVIFELNGEIYGLDIAIVHEIIRMQPVTRVPKAPAYVEGVINLRGKVIPVIDLGKKFGIEGVERGKNSRVVVVNIREATIGVIVDAVTEVMRIPGDLVEPVTGIVTYGHMDYLDGVAKVGEKMVILLALEKLLVEDKKLAAIALKSNMGKPELAGVK
jgi:purine-binding chemotaxis protein CheW